MVHIPDVKLTQNTQTSFGKALIERIDAAQKEIVFAIYGLRGQDAIYQALLRAQARGVVIRGVVDSDTKGRNYYDDTPLLHRAFEIVSDGKSAIMHNKFFVFDRRWVWTGSANISDTGTGGYNANAVLLIEDETTAHLYYEAFKEMYNDKRFGKKKRPSQAHTIHTSTSTINLYFSPQGHTYERGIKPLIARAQKYIYIPIFYLTHKDLAQDLIEAYQRGVEVKIIVDASSARNRYSIHKALRQAGIKVKVENFGGKMHAKGMIVDDAYFVAGSMNFTKAGNATNDENTLIVHNPKLAVQYKDYFLTLWARIPDTYLAFDPAPESPYSVGSCDDGIDNDFDTRIDAKDDSCRKLFK